MKEAVLVEARVGDLHAFAAAQVRAGIARRIVTLQLPLPCDAGVVSSLLHVMPDGLGLRIHRAEIGPVTVVVSAGHQLDSCVGAERLGVGVAELNALCREPVNRWSAIARAAVGADALYADVVGHDQHNVWTIRRRRQRGRSQSEHRHKQPSQLIHHSTHWRGLYRAVSINTIHPIKCCRAVFFPIETKPRA